MFAPVFLSVLGTPLRGEGGLGPPSPPAFGTGSAQTVALALPRLLPPAQPFV